MNFGRLENCVLHNFPNKNKKKSESSIVNFQIFQSNLTYLTYFSVNSEEEINSLLLKTFTM